MKSFIGGIHPDYNKLTRKNKIAVAPNPEKIILPLSMHIGASCEPLVKVGDTVKIGQKVAESSSLVSAPIHSSISGVVKSIEEQPHPVLGTSKAIIIESNNKIEWDESVKSRDNVDKLTKEQLLEIIKQAGIVGMGGAAFPTHVKLNPKQEITTLILNGAECEPYLTCDHSLMLEHSEEIVKGALLLKKILKPKKTFIGIEDAILILEEKIEELKADIDVVKLKTIYPQGAEKSLIYSITGKKVPPGKLPMDIGCVVQNVGTSKAVYDAVYQGKPLIERVITITGAVNDRKNLLVKIGTQVSELIQHCKGYMGTPKKIITGGPMMGIAQYTDDIPIIKGTSGILVLSNVEKETEKGCVKCGKCVDVCPMDLVPAFCAKLSEKGLYDAAKSWHAESCIECGCCAYVCPSKIPLVQKIKLGKNEILKK